MPNNYRQAQDLINKRREDAEAEAERRRICTYLMDEITAIAVAQPKHTVVPYRNKPKKEYPTNIPKENLYEIHRSRTQGR